MFINFSHADTSRSPVAPMLPPAGPVKMSVSFKRPNPKLSKMIFSIMTNEMKPSKSSIAASLTAVGVDRSVNGSLSWRYAHKTFVFDGSLSSALANSSTVVIVNVNSQLNIESYANFNSSLANFTVGFGLSSTHINANSSLVIGKHRIYQVALRGSRRQFNNGKLSFYLFIGDKRLPHTYDMTVDLSKWQANITGQLLLSGESEPHTVIVSGSFGKYYLNMTGLFKLASECELYQMGFNGSYEPGNVRSHFMIDLPHIIKRQDIYLRGSVGLVFAHLSAAIYQTNRVKPHKIDINADIDSSVFANMNGSLLLANNDEAHWSIKTNLSKWSIESNTHLQVVNKPNSNMRVSASYQRNKVSGLALINVPGLFEDYSNRFSNNSVTWFFQKISHILYQPKQGKSHNITVKGVLNKWYSNVSMYVHMARDINHHYLNFNSSFAKWYINGTALLRPANYRKPHRVHLSGDIGKQFLNGSAFFHQGCHKTDFDSDKCEDCPYRVNFRGEIGKQYVDTKAGFQMPGSRCKVPHSASLRASVKKWSMNISATTHLQLNNNDWNKRHYVNSTMSLDGRAIQLSAKSSLFDLRSVKEFLRMDENRVAEKLESSPTATTTLQPEPTDAGKCKQLKKHIKLYFGNKKCETVRTFSVCSSNCKELYSRNTIAANFSCTTWDHPLDTEHDQKKFELLAVPKLEKCCNRGICTWK